MYNFLVSSVSPVLKNSTHFVNTVKVFILGYFQNRSFSQASSLCSKCMKVAILGAGTKTGSCLSLFLKQSCLIDELALYDSKPIRGLALELGHVDTKCKIAGCTQNETCLKRALQGAKVVAIVDDDTSDTHDLVLRTNAEILSGLLPSVIRFCPGALVAIAMNPTDSLIPLAVEMCKKAGIHEHGRLFGVTSLDCMRANCCVSEAIGIEPERIMVPVIGGSSSRTCVPIFSQTKPHYEFTKAEIVKLTRLFRAYNDEIINSNQTGQPLFLAKAFAIARFCTSLCKALKHQRGVIECAYVRTCILSEVTYFTTSFELGSEGIQKYLSLPPLANIERKLLNATIPYLKLAIKQGETLALGHSAKSSETCDRTSHSCDPIFIPSFIHRARS